MQPFKDCRQHVPVKAGGVAKAELFRSPRLLLGLNALEPGVEQVVHTHEGQDKFYYVVEGTGRFTVGDLVQDLGPGHVIWAPADVIHGVRNDSAERLVVLVGIAPAP